VVFSTKLYCKFNGESAYNRILRSVNIWLSYRQESWSPHALSVSGHCPAERWTTRQISWVWQETAVVSCCYIDFVKLVYTDFVLPTDIINSSESLTEFLKRTTSCRHISQGRVATRLRCGGIFNCHFIGNLSQSLTMKEFW